MFFLTFNFLYLVRNAVDVAILEADPLFHQMQSYLIEFGQKEKMSREIFIAVNNASVKMTSDLFVQTRMVADVDARIVAVTERAREHSAALRAMEPLWLAASDVSHQEDAYVSLVAEIHRRREFAEALTRKAERLQAALSKGVKLELNVRQHYQRTVPTLRTLSVLANVLVCTTTIIFSFTPLTSSH